MCPYEAHGTRHSLGDNCSSRALTEGAVAAAAQANSSLELLLSHQGPSASYYPAIPCGDVYVPERDADYTLAGNGGMVAEDVGGK